MPIETTKPNSDSDDGEGFQAIGFYSMLSLEGIGFCGGFLVLNRLGRPVEFHCTMPVQPNRSQEILYGETLVPHLFAEHIGPPLIQKAKEKVDVVLVDTHMAADLSRHLEVPVIQVTQDKDSGPIFHRYQRGISNVAWDLGGLPDLDWREPFQRIVTAIDEAHAVAR